MTMAQLRKAADWLKILDQAADWRSNFAEHTKSPFIEFGQISSQTQADGMGTGRGWDGELIVPREVAAEMMARLEERARVELKKLGVKS